MRHSNCVGVRFCSVVIVCCFAAGSAGCGRVLAPPEAPPRTVPAVPDVPALIPSGQGRALIDSAGEPARVFAVTAGTHGAFAALTDGHHSAQPLVGGEIGSHAISPDVVRPLCMTPCAVDAAPGYQYLLLESVNDPRRHSYADLSVYAQRTTVLQHRLGSERGVSPAWAGGFLSTFAGSGLVLLGGAMLGVAALSPKKDSALPVLGASVLGAGVVLDVIGIWQMMQHQPERQPGSSAMWTVP